VLSEKGIFVKTIFGTLTVCAAVLIAAIATATPFDGLYKLVDGSWSCNPEDIGMDSGALSLQDGYLHGIENSCELTEPTNVRGMDAVLYDALCSGEGEQYSYRLMILRHEQGIYLVQDDYVAEWHNCQ